MQTASQTIYFDYESNYFYRINKQTGQFTKSYKNGNDLKTFKPNITGFNYKSRKVFFEQIQLCIQNHQDIKNKRMSPNQLQKRQNDFQRRTIDNFNNKSDQKSKEKLKNKSLNFHFQSQILSHINNPQKPDIFLKKGKLPNLKQNINGLNGQNINSESPNSQNLDNQEETTKQLFSLTLRRFSEVNKYKERQNNSLRKHIKGNQQKVQGQLQKNIINLKNYKTLDPLSDGYKTQNKEKITLKRQLNLPSFYSVKQQKNRQNSLFFRSKYLSYEVHPQASKEQTQDMKEREEQRRKNMKQLQQLFIKQNQIKTNQIYSKAKQNDKIINLD